MTEGERKAAIERIKSGDSTWDDFWNILENMTDEEYADEKLQNHIDGFIDSLEQ
jgi:hypothetical protein